MSKSTRKVGDVLFGFEDGVWTVELQATRTKKGHFQNTFTPSLIKAINSCLDEIEASSFDGPASLLVTSVGKFFSNGHDIPWLEDAVAQDKDAADRFIRDFYRLLARLMTFPMFTIAAINGHAFAGGFLLAMALDYRLMSASKGFLCMNEIDMAIIASETEKKSVIKPGLFEGADEKMVAVLAAKLDRSVLQTVLLEGKRYDAHHAKSLGIVHEVARDEAALREESLAFAKVVAKKSPLVNQRTGLSGTVTAGSSLMEGAQSPDARF